MAAPENDEVSISVKKIDHTIAAMNILHRLVKVCQKNRDELPEDVVWILSEWESFNV